MFKKKPNIKPFAPLRSSDRRRIADQIIKDLGLEVPDTQEGDVEAQAASTAEHTSLRNRLLPDNAQSARFTTTHGPDLRKVSGTVYVGTHPGEEQRALWVNIEDRMYPTVYTLWKNAGILPLLHTPNIVVEKLRGGADLMTPGLAGPPFPSDAKKGSLVAVASVENPSVPMVIGTCVIDVSSLDSVRGAKGHAVQTAHWCGDELWTWSATGRPGTPAPPHLEGWIKDVPDGDDLANRTEDLDLEEDGGDEGGVPLKAAGASEAEPSNKNPTNGEGNGSKTELFEKVDSPELTTKDIDEAFHKAFIYGVHHYKETNKGHSTFGLQFPLSQSFVMSNLVQPFLPAHSPEQTTALQIKKTSWKNIKKFMKHLDKQKIVKTKDRDGNEVVILDIDFDDREILEFIPYKLPKKETIAGTSLGRGGKATTEIDTGDDSVGQSIHVVTLYRPKERLSPIFGSEPSSKSLLTASDIRPVVMNYIESESLISPTNKRLVKLNPVLANAVFDGSSSLDSEVVAKGTVPRDALIDRIISSCSPHHVILRNDQDLSQVKPRSGVAPKVKIIMETRSGNKTVTKISGIESFYIPPQPLAEELKKVCAGSTSVEKLVGSSPKEDRKEIMVQGPQKDAVIKALERRGIKSQWVEVTDKTKGKKR
ncbi:MAG: hypothetical protein M1821_009177 [Bathelium mastoideum]|nr:MAG: hypothetical protein M1821_009177 [Bathelium mastoideum]KAI9689502.1 MAG: hypothetical protein M1822_010153 [Bathelium mastoideum]